MYEIKYANGVAIDLKKFRAFDRTKILDIIEDQLTFQPTQQTRKRKILVGLIPPWEYLETCWELRIDNYRVFYDVDEDKYIVTIRAIRYKPPHKTTEEIL